MDKFAIQQQLAKYQRARSALLTVVALTGINLLLSALNTSFYMLFSASAPLLIFEISHIFAEELQNNILLVAGLAMACIIVIVYFICWFFAKRFRAFILVALILFSIDSLILLLLMLCGGFEVIYLLDIAFHGWILLYLINGTIAWAKLRGLNPDDLASAYTKSPAISTGEEYGNNSCDLTNTKSPLRADDKKGRILISANYAGLEITMKRTHGLTELIVDGYVYDEIRGTIEIRYSLTAKVQGINIIGSYNSTNSRMYLYANDELIAKKLRLY